MSSRPKNIAMVGAGPAAMYATKKLNDAGHNVFIINRDIKPGGLAEFGIYPTKTKMKMGLRRMFDMILKSDGVYYYGNVKVGEEDDITVDQLKDIDFDAYVFAVGAQGTKKLGLPGEDSKGVYHAKDLVYHYNGLPPFSEREYDIGDDACVIGLGNVCLDIAHYFICEEKISSVTAVGRRGPNERKMTDRELKIISGALDIDQIQNEFDHISPSLKEVDQDPNESFEDLTKYADNPLEVSSDTDFRFRFLLSPKRVETDNAGRVRGLTCQKTRLCRTEEDDIGFEKLDDEETIACDTLVFAVGDRIEPGLGLPIDPETSSFATVPESWEKYPDRPRYMVFDPEAEDPMSDTFVIGWAREASEGVVGKAKKDAERGCDEIMAFLEGEFDESPGQSSSAARMRKKLDEKLDGLPYVNYEDVLEIKDIEKRRARKSQEDDFKFESDKRMLSAIGICLATLLVLVGCASDKSVDKSSPPNRPSSPSKVADPNLQNLGPSAEIETADGGATAHQGASRLRAKDLKALLQKSPSYLLSQVDTTPVRANGKFVGYRITEFSKQATSFLTPKVKPGDIITGINGTRIRKPGDYMEVWRQLPDRGKITIEYRRGEQHNKAVWLVTNETR